MKFLKSRAKSKATVSYTEALNWLEPKMGSKAKSSEWKRMVSFIDSGVELQSLVVSIYLALQTLENGNFEAKFGDAIVTQLNSVHARYACFELISNIIGDDLGPVTLLLDQANYDAYKEWRQMISINNRVTDIAHNWGEQFPDRYLHGADVTTAPMCDVVVGLIVKMKGIDT